MKKRVTIGCASKTKQQLLFEIEAIKYRLLETEDALEAIRAGAVDAFVVSDTQGEKIFTLQSADYSYRVMAESMNEGAVTLDKDSVIVFTNKAFSDLLGREMSTLMGTRFSDCLPITLQGFFTAFIKECAVHPHRNEFSVNRAPEGTIPVTISGTIFEINGRQNTCLIINDLSEHKNAEQKLRNAYNEVEGKVVERTLQLQKVNDDIQKRTDELVLANKGLEIFSYSVAHDLRNPLNAITANIEFLSMEVGAKQGTDSYTAMMYIKESANRMAQVITDLLTLSGISRKEIKVQKGDLSEMVQNIISELKVSEPHREVETNIQPGLTVTADPGLLRILVENIIRNAWKFTSQRAMARIELGSFDKDDKRCYFIRDNGVGFDMKDSIKVFQPYIRLLTEHAFKGSGIGLAIAKRIVEKHGGAIWAEGEKEKGATFYFCFA